MATFKVIEQGDGTDLDGAGRARRVEAPAGAGDDRASQRELWPAVAKATGAGARRLSLQQLEAHLWGAANILRGRKAGQDYKNYILSLMFFKRLCDQWEHEADEAIAELERQQGRQFTEQQKAVFWAREGHRCSIPQDAYAGAKAQSR